MNHVNINPNHIYLQATFAPAESRMYCSHSKATSCKGERLTSVKIFSFCKFNKTHVTIALWLKLH